MTSFFDRWSRLTVLCAERGVAPQLASDMHQRHILVASDYVKKAVESGYAADIALDQRDQDLHALLAGKVGSAAEYSPGRELLYWAHFTAVAMSKASPTVLYKAGADGWSAMGLFDLLLIERLHDLAHDWARKGGSDHPDIPDQDGFVGWIRANFGDV